MRKDGLETGAPAVVSIAWRQYRGRVDQREQAGKQIGWCQDTALLWEGFFRLFQTNQRNQSRWEEARPPSSRPSPPGEGGYSAALQNDIDPSRRMVSSLWENYRLA